MCAKCSTYQPASSDKKYPNKKTNWPAPIKKISQWKKQIGAGQYVFLLGYIFIVTKKYPNKTKYWPAKPPGGLELRWTTQLSLFQPRWRKKWSWWWWWWYSGWGQWRLWRRQWWQQYGWWWRRQWWQWHYWWWQRHWWWFRVVGHLAGTAGCCHISSASARILKQMKRFKIKYLCWSQP